MTKAKQWQQSDREIEKFGDVRSVRDPFHHLPMTPQPKQAETTPEIAQRRQADDKFQIKKVS